MAAPAAATKAAWEEKWEKTLAAAKDEGKVVISTNVGPAARAFLVRGLKDAYGIDVEAISGSSTQINTKILAERRAGLYFWDVGLSGTTSPYTQLEPAGALASLDSALILPDVTDPQLIKKIWYRGELWFVDRDHLIVATLLTPHPAVIAVNSNVVKPEEIKSFNDFLEPKWKGKFSLNDPTLPGSTFQSFLMYLYGPDWLRKLAKQEPIIMRDERLQLEWLAHGKTPAGLGVKSELYGEFRNLGAPVQGITPTEGSYLTAGSTAIMLISKTAHPNAAAVFINWLLSKEAQTTLSEVAGGHSTREDVSIKHLPPDQVRQAGVKYWEKERKEANLKKADDIEVCKEIFGPLMKK